MNTMPQSPPAPQLYRRLPLLRLLNPREYLSATLLALGVGLSAGWAAMTVWSAPFWMFSIIVLAALLPVGVRKWRDDLRRYGWVVMVLSILLIAQGVHTLEHIVQWVQYHSLYLTMRKSTGLVTAANAEWVHFLWNWAVWITVGLLIRGGMRSPWAYLLLAVATAHTLEHTYLFARHFQVLAELKSFGVTTLTAQGLPGILGRDGWLARSPYTQRTLLCSLPGLTTAVRLDVHFWWNVVEMALALCAGHVYLRRATRFNEFRSRSNL